MPKSLLPALIVLGLANVSCGNQSDKKKDQVANQSDPRAAVPGVKDSPILGLWKICTPLLAAEDEEVEAPLPEIKSVLQSMAFNEQGQGSKGISFHKDDDCIVDFAEADLQAYLVELEDWFKAQGVPELPAEAREQVREQFSAQKDLFSYRLESTQSLAGHLDLIDAQSGRTAYTTYKISGNSLQVAGTCDQETVASGEDPDCTEVVGDSPGNRAKDFNILLFK